MAARILMRPPHRGHSKTSIEKTRRINSVRLLLGARTARRNPITPEATYADLSAFVEAKIDAFGVLIRSGWPAP
jgi:hypothetical protein